MSPALGFATWRTGALDTGTTTAAAGLVTDPVGVIGAAAAAGDTLATALDVAGAQVTSATAGTPGVSATPGAGRGVGVGAAPTNTGTDTATSWPVLAEWA